ncbi:hypothetical protein Nepgr_016072 [Nepenthes gracilis]|uniref:Protein kinase domain-containing protein n=1 Tax=Nepenthes gracilis TaxID=150966 RepID=A0AAD3SPN3_NEPGR|nr:hypothetical protein Nepgr_016072 [Nepenthes gracilis]
MAWKEIYFVLRIYVVLFDLTVLGSAVPAMPSSISPSQYYAKMRSHGFASFLAIVHHKHHHHHHHHHHNARNRSGTSAPRPAYLLHPPMHSPEDCTSTACTDPMTYSISGYPCACVWPIQIRLRIGVSLYTFFPLVTELAAEIATSLSLNQSQVRIMGADAASQQQEETYALMNLVPINEKFDKNTALSIYEKFWDSQVLINSSIFGAYEVIYVIYPGLPPCPPSSFSNDGTIASNPYPSNGNPGSLPKPIGVDIPRSRRKGISRSLLLVIILSSFTAFTIFMGIAWLLILKYKRSAHHKEEAAPSIMSPVSIPSGATESLCIGSTAGTTLMSLISSIPTLTGSAKIFSLSEIEKATNSFNAMRVLGEGGFGVVYSGILDDETKVAVKVLKRDDRQGGCEFLAEVKMLCRLHHRNLVKLIGICAEDHIRCLVYELVPNGSVESHLHGADKEVAPLDWGARMKISLGAARGLAYLHEDSSPPVIHRDFKSSNILLECDFTPKVSDFGLARAAVNDGSALTLTQVMGTFGYVAPEYAMTGQLLVKSDVYSYGVVLLELLTGRKPVDLSQKPGEENLVAWARPLLSSNEGIESLIDPALKPTVLLESFSKVAAIASMCVEPEVCRRPFMGEVVQALKLVCNEFDDKEEGSRSFHRTDISIDIDSKVSENSLDLEEFSPTHHPVLGYESTPETTAAAFLASDLVSTSAGFRDDESASFRRPFNSGPLRLGKKRNFWQRLRGISIGSVSEHGFSYSQFPGSR